MSRTPFSLDERQKEIVRRISSILYIITIWALIGIQLYRQFVLDQLTEEWNDIAILITFNVVVWIGGLFYISGTVDPSRVKVRYLLLAFTGFVLLGLAFTIFKYAVLLDQAIGVSDILDYFFIVAKISALLLGLWGLLAYLGSRRIEEQIR